MKKCNKCGDQIPNSIWVDGVKRNLCNRKYCLKCSPFQKHNTKKLEQPHITERKCPKCKIVKSTTEFYKRRNKDGSSTYCKTCTIKQTLVRQRKFKEKCLSYKGGACERCGYNKCVNALEFHHILSDKKDFNISNCKLTTFNEAIKKELDKCKLLCANCHREIHYLN